MSEESENLKQQLHAFESELNAVNLSLSSISESDSNYEQLVELKTKLEQIIDLTKHEYLEAEKRRLYDELALDDSRESESTTEQQEFDGKCMVPWRHQNGQIEYYNALVMGEESRTEEHTYVRVIFCNPSILKMKPCSYYMRGECRYSDERCKYSHGYVVDLAQIKQFQPIDCSLLNIDSCVLVKTEDCEIWRKAKVQQSLENFKYVVKLVDSDESVTVDLEYLAPFESVNYENSENFDNEFDSEEAIVVAWNNIDFGASAIGTWEAHTRGIGSKLMKKMGYVWGQGLGKDGQGRIEPIEAIVFPERKSLDACIEFKSNGLVRSKLKNEEKRKQQENQIANGYHSVNPETVFDFLNKNIANSSKKKDEKKNFCIEKSFVESLKTSSNQSLNIKAFKLDEEMKKTQNEMLRLKKGIERNELRDKKTHSDLKEKFIEMEKFMNVLKEKEKLVENEQQRRSTHQKLTNF